jgi:hypothetical protein
MTNIWLKGNFSDNPLPYLLYKMWSSKRTGQLKIKKQKVSKQLFFLEGTIIFSASPFDIKRFFSFLEKEKLVQPSSLKKCEKFSKLNKISLLKSATELSLISSLELWNLLEIFLINDILPLFDWPKAEYLFEPSPENKKSEILISLSPVKIIHKGIIQMKNQDIINSFIPSPEEYIHTYPNRSFLITDLKPNELYLLNTIGNKIKINELYQLCHMGKGEINRIIYLFICLRIAGPPQKNLNHITQELSRIELYNMLESFNKKCIYIFKYISKEIGPVALSLLEKCVKDIKTNLPPQLQNIHLTQEGKVNLISTPSINSGLPGEVKSEEFLNALNEILVSELLAVKKTLGDEHESKVAKDLKDIGKWNSKKNKS